MNHRFPGQIYDEESGLHYNFHRYYNPATGTYVTSDPIGLDGGINTYVYALQNPIIFSDPTGEAVPQVVVAIAALCARFPKVCKAILNCARKPKKCAKKSCVVLVNTVKHPICDFIGGSCSGGGQSCFTLKRKQVGNKACLAIRQFELKVCFSNRDFAGGHRTRIKNVKNRIKKCQNKINNPQDPCCK